MWICLFIIYSRDLQNRLALIVMMMLCAYVFVSIIYVYCIYFYNYLKYIVNLLFLFFGVQTCEEHSLWITSVNKLHSNNIVVFIYLFAFISVFCFVDRLKSIFRLHTFSLSPSTIVFVWFLFFEMVWWLSEISSH